MSRLRSTLQLVRLPNVLTAAADSLAGWLIVGGSLGDVARWLPLALASMGLYAAGMALNDWFDLEVDRLERPNRPLPSGRVPVGLAAAIGWGGLALGIALAALGGQRTFGVACALAGMILAYNSGLKHTFLGPWAMGSCRGLNMLLGMAAASSAGFPAAWIAAGAFALFVAGVTWISRSEAWGGERRNLVIGLGIQVLALVILGVVAAAFGAVGPFAVVGILLLVLVLAKVVQVGRIAIREASPAVIQQAVKTGVLSLVWLDVALVAAACGPAALAVAAIWPPAYLLARRLYAT
ncbi:UbiA family prenyltransferase [Paludisphaera rhizosphaerae]|uniref:UbiA family prenyltransferase n=1 Tax=Paludisphaera rhizosphaerae TaxID=2711216 RepID=UPI0013EDCCBF|nr:UbiA family prenyltransferase [Paludisphaera rhizosphaerae]